MQYFNSFKITNLKLRKLIRLLKIQTFLIRSKMCKEKSSMSFSEFHQFLFYFMYLMYSSPKNLYGFLYICNPKEDMVNNISTVLVHYNEIHLSIY